MRGGIDHFPTNSPGYIFLASMINIDQPNLGLDALDATVIIEDVTHSRRSFFDSTRDASVIGTTVMQAGEFEVADLVSDVKQREPDARFYIGGPLVTTAPRYALKVTGADAAFLGEAEFTFRKAVGMQLAGRPLEDLVEIGSVLVQKNDQILGPKNPEIPFLDKDTIEGIEIDFDAMAALQDKMHYRQFSFNFARGCPYPPCSFCYESVASNKHRRMSDEKVLGIIEKIAQLSHVKALVMYESVFGGSSDGTIKLLQTLDASDYGFSAYNGAFSIEMFLEPGRVGSRDLNHKLIDLVARLNVSAEIGVQHLSQGGLAKYNRLRYTVDEVFRVAEALNEAGAHGVLEFIDIGNTHTPEETAQHFTNALLLHSKLGTQPPNSYLGHHSIGMQHYGFCKPLLGSAEYTRLRKIIESDSDYRDFLGRIGSLVLTPEDPQPFLIKSPLPYDIHLANALADQSFYLTRNRNSGDYRFDMFFLMEALKRHADPRIGDRLDSLELPGLKSIRDSAVNAYEDYERPFPAFANWAEAASLIKR